MIHKYKKFADNFLQSFDFEKACKIAKANPSRVLVALSDPDSDLSTYINEGMDTRRISNSFITPELVRNELYRIVVTGEPTHKIQAAKLILGFDNMEDRSDEFRILAKAILNSDNTETKSQ